MVLRMMTEELRHGYQIDELAAIFEQHGFPVRGCLDLVGGADARGAAVVSFSVSDIRLAPIEPEHVAVPSDYLDTRLPDNWRTLHERAPKTPPVVLQPSKVRRPGAGYHRPARPAFRIPNPIRNPEGDDDGEDQPIGSRTNA
jgi:hypothetical protein